MRGEVAAMRRCKNRSAVMAAVRVGAGWGGGRMRGLADDCCPHPPYGHLPPLAGEGWGCQRSSARREGEYVDKSTRPEGSQARRPGGERARRPGEGQESGRPGGKRARRQEDEKDWVGLRSGGSTPDARRSSASLLPRAGEGGAQRRMRGASGTEAVSHTTASPCALAWRPSHHPNLFPSGRTAIAGLLRTSRPDS